MEWSLLSSGTQAAVSNDSVLIKMPYFYLALAASSYSHKSWISRFYITDENSSKYQVYLTKVSFNSSRKDPFKLGDGLIYYLLVCDHGFRFCSLTLLRRNSVFFFLSPSRNLFSLFLNGRRKAFLPSSISYALSRNH